MLCNDCEKETTENQTEKTENVEKTAISGNDKNTEKNDENPKLEYSFQPDAETKTKEPNQDTNVYVQIGTEYVKTDTSINHSYKPPEASGIMYEIAEELYKKEKTASDIEALCQPPFRKIFGIDQMNQLDREAGEKTQQLLATVSDTIKKEVENGFKIVRKEQLKQQRPISTVTAFFLQLMLAIPVLNIVVALIFSFGKNSNDNLRSYTKAFVIWCTVLMAGALVFFAAYTFGSEESRTEIQKFISFAIPK